MTGTKTPTPERGVMTFLTKDLGFSAENANNVLVADQYMDEALDAVDEEEPSLLAWLKGDPDLERLCWANRSTMYWVIKKDLAEGVPLEVTIYKLGALVSRVLAATSWRATMRAREGTSHP